MNTVSWQKYIRLLIYGVLTECWKWNSLYLKNNTVIMLINIWILPEYFSYITYIEPIDIKYIVIHSHIFLKLYCFHGNKRTVYYILMDTRKHLINYHVHIYCFQKFWDEWDNKYKTRQTYRRDETKRHRWFLKSYSPL